MNKFFMTNRQFDQTRFDTNFNLNYLGFIKIFANRIWRKFTRRIPYVNLELQLA